MKKTALCGIAMSFVLLASIVTTSAGPSPADDRIASGGDGETLHGSFLWVREGEEDLGGDLKAVFQGTEAGKWKVSFHFIWEDEPRVWSGTAEGSLDEGTLRGKVMDDGQENTFVFDGSFQNGEFQGTHAHIGKEGKESPTGRLTLKR